MKDEARAGNHIGIRRIGSCWGTCPILHHLAYCCEPIHSNSWSQLQNRHSVSRNTGAALWTHGQLFFFVENNNNNPTTQTLPILFWVITYQALFGSAHGMLNSSICCVRVGPWVVETVVNKFLKLNNACSFYFPLSVRNAPRSDVLQLPETIQTNSIVCFRFTPHLNLRRKQMKN